MSSEAAVGGSFRGKTHVLPVRIYFEDTDFSGVVYHANYLRYLERGRSDCLRLMGVHHRDLWEREEPLAFTIQRMEIDFRIPAVIDDVLEVHTRYAHLSGARLNAEQSIWRGQDEIVRARVFAGCINHQGRARRIPADVRAILERFMAAG
jgi:acyl-CoA thioester hydrolase